MFIRLLTGLVNGFHHLIIQNTYHWGIRNIWFNQLLSIYIPLNAVWELHYYPFAIKLDRCVGSNKALNDLCNKVCVPNKTEDLNLCVFNMITGVNESKTLTKHVSYKCKCKFDGRKYNSYQKWNKDKCWCECEKHHICEKDYIWNPARCSCKNGKYLGSIIDNSVIRCDEILDAEQTKTILKYIFCEARTFYILLAFLLLTIALLRAFSVYFCLIKYKAKQKHLFPSDVPNDKLINIL